MNESILKDYLSYFDSFDNSIKKGQAMIIFKQNTELNQNEVGEIINYCYENELVIPDARNERFEMLSAKGKEVLSQLS